MYNFKISQRKLDELGRIVIQKEFRTEYSWNEKDMLQIYLYKDMIILKKYENKCIFCFNEKHLDDFKGKKYAIAVNNKYQKISLLALHIFEKWTHKKIIKFYI